MLYASVIPDKRDVVNNLVWKHFIFQVSKSNQMEKYSNNFHDKVVFTLGGQGTDTRTLDLTVQFIRLV